MVQEMNEFPYFKTVFFGQYASVKLRKQHIKIQLSLSATCRYLVCLHYIFFQDDICDLAREVFFGLPGRPEGW